MSAITLVVGAAGKFDGFVLPELVARGATVRAFVRNADAAFSVKEDGAAEVTIGDLSDPQSVVAALDGGSSVFYIAPAFMPNEAETGIAFIDAAKAAGIRRIVFSSVIHPMISALSNHGGKAPVEEAILDSGLGYSFLHAALFFQNYSRAFAGVAKSGVLAEPWSSETRFSRVDYRDVAEVAAIALTEDKLLHGTFELCAPGELNRLDIAALLSDVLGRHVRPERIDPATLGPRAAPMRAIFDHYDHHGLLGCPLTLTAILDREPRSLRAFFAELASSDAAA